MRAAQTALRRPGLPMLRPAVERPHREHTSQTESRAALVFGVIFLAGYLPGIWLDAAGQRLWGSSWRPTTQAAPKVRALRQPSGRSLR